MARVRRAPNMAEKLDATLHALLAAQGRPVAREEAKAMPVGMLARRFDFDHDPIKYVHGGTTHPSNLTPRLRAEHGRKTAKKDVPEIRKGMRLAKKHPPAPQSAEEFRARMLAFKAPDETAEAKPERAARYHWPKRAMQSRNTLRRRPE
jgi:hypothetical protein